MLHSLKTITIDFACAAVWPLEQNEPPGNVYNVSAVYQPYPDADGSPNIRHQENAKPSDISYSHRDDGFPSKPSVEQPILYEFKAVGHEITKHLFWKIPSRNCFLLPLQNLARSFVCSFQRKDSPFNGIVLVPLRCSLGPSVVISSSALVTIPVGEGSSAATSGCSCGCRPGCVHIPWS